MTILVGILCEDGAIIASDGMASNNLGTTPFVGLSNLKTHIVDDELIFACAGDDNLMTLFGHFLRQNYSGLSQKHQAEDSDIFALMTELGASFTHRILSHYTAYPQIIIEQQLAEIAKNGFNFQAIVALPFKDIHYIFQYDSCLQPSMLRENGIWHVILGTGYYVAQPSIHLVKKMLNITKKPKIDRGQTLAYWTVSHAIEVSSGGIGGDITIAVLRKTDEGYKAVIENNSSEHKAFIEDIYKYIGRYGENSNEELIEEIPKLESSLIVENDKLLESTAA